MQGNKTRQLCLARMSDVSGHMVCIKVDGKDVDLHDFNQMNIVAQAKMVEFYEFSAKIIETIVYKSDTIGICDSYQNGSIISKSATNYYAKEGVFATLMNSNLSVKDKPKLADLEFKFDIENELLSSVMAQARSAEFREKVIEKDLIKQERILKNIICNAKSSK